MDIKSLQLDKPEKLGRTRGMLYANVNKKVELKGTPVLSDTEFAKLKEEILNKH